MIKDKQHPFKSKQIYTGDTSYADNTERRKKHKTGEMKVKDAKNEKHTTTSDKAAGVR